MEIREGDVFYSAFNHNRFQILDTNPFVGTWINPETFIKLDPIRNSGLTFNEVKRLVESKDFVFLGNFSKSSKVRSLYEKLNG